MDPTPVSVEARVLGLYMDHPSVQAAINELKTDLRDAPSSVDVREAALPDKGTKGSISDIIIAMGTPAGIAGVARIFHLWLSRDKHRSLLLTHRSGGRETVIEIDGENVSAETVDQAVRAMWGEQSETDQGELKH